MEIVSVILLLRVMHHRWLKLEAIQMKNILKNILMIMQVKELCYSSESYGFVSIVMLLGPVTLLL